MEYQDTIMNRICEGDELAFSEFMDRYSTILLYQAEGIVKDHSLAEEIVSDVFFETWKKRKDLLEVTNIKSWLSTITYHKSISTLRKEIKHQKILSIDTQDGFDFPDVQPNGESDQEEEQVQQLNEAIKQLPNKARYVFFLAKIQQLPYEEIARTLHISLATVNYHVGFALKSLKNKLLRKNNRK